MRRVMFMLCSVLILGGCARTAAPTKLPATAPVDFVMPSVPALTPQKQLTHFLTTEFVQPKGIITTLGTPKGDGAIGQEQLVESSGMWLLHLANTRRFKAFRTFYQATKKRFYNGHTFTYRYDPRHPKRYKVNASGDDLRVLRALLAYDEASGSTHYHDEVAQLMANWAAVCMPNGELRDFYDTGLRKTSEAGALAYFDLQTLKYLQQGTKTGRANYREQLAVVQHGYLGDAIPLYAADYNWVTGQYATKALNMSEALIVLLNLTRVGELKDTSYQWLKERVRYGFLPNGIATNGTITDRNQSVANWAIAAQIFALKNNRADYDRCMQFIWDKQVRATGKMHGGFGDVKTGVAYSFNNLTALLASEAGGASYGED